MAGRLEGRVAIVTGGGHGIGKAYARGLAGEGASVVVAEIDAAAGDAVAGSLVQEGFKAIAAPTDVSDWKSIEAMARRAVDAYGRIDVLVNNAAIFATVPMSRAPFDQIDPAEWDRMMAVNLRGPWLAARAVVPQMKAQRYGKIVNISSGTALKGSASRIHYVTSKAGILRLTRPGAGGRRVGHLRQLRRARQHALRGQSRRGHAQDAQRGCVGPRLAPGTEAQGRGRDPVLRSADSDFVTGQTLVVERRLGDALESRRAAVQEREMGEIAVVVKEARPLTPAIRELLLVSADGAALPAWEPGAHVELDVTLAGGAVERRAYCLIGGTETEDDPANAYRIAVERQVESRGGSRFLCDEVTVGAMSVDFAAAQRIPASSASGGPGARRRRRRHRADLCDGARTGPPLHSVPTPLCRPRRGRYGVSRRARAARRRQGPFPLRRRAARSRSGVRDLGYPAEIYLCGQRPLNKALAASAMEHGLSRLQILQLCFDPPLPPAPSGNIGFEVELRTSGITAHVPPDASILETLLSVGYQAQFYAAAANAAFVRCRCWRRMARSNIATTTFSPRSAASGSASASRASRTDRSSSSTRERRRGARLGGAGTKRSRPR